MLNDDEQFYMEREFAGLVGRLRARPATPDDDLEDTDYREEEMRERGLDPENDHHWDMMAAQDFN